MTPYEMEGVVELVLRCTSPLPLSRIVLSIALVLIVMPIVAVGIVVDGITYDANMSVTYSPANPIVNEQVAWYITIKNTGTVNTNFIVGWGPEDMAESTFSFTLAPGSTTTPFIKAYIPKKSGNITFKFSIYRESQPNNQLLQQITRTITVYPRSQTPTIVTPTPSVSFPSPTQSLPPTSTLPGTTPEVSGFEFGIAALAIITLLFLKRIRMW